jgi:hypothetical protein
MFRCMSRTSFGIVGESSRLLDIGKIVVQRAFQINSISSRSPFQIRCVPGARFYSPCAALSTQHSARRTS